MKKPKGRNRLSKNQPSKEAVLSALSTLEEMRKSKKLFQVAIFLPPLVLSFESVVEKRPELDWYALSKPDLDIELLPEMCDLIGFSQEGGLLLGRKDISVMIEPEEHTTEELLALYPGASKFIH